MAQTAGCGVVLLMLAVSWLVTGLVIMLLWNVIVPGVFGGPALTLWQAMIGGFLVSVIGKLLGFGGSSSRS